MGSLDLGIGGAAEADLLLFEHSKRLDRNLIDVTGQTADARARY